MSKDFVIKCFLCNDNDVLNYRTCVEHDQKEKAPELSSECDSCYNGACAMSCGECNECGVVRVSYSCQTVSNFDAEAKMKIRDYLKGNPQNEPLCINTENINKFAK